MNLHFEASKERISTHDPAYKGDIDHCRIRADFEYNGVRFHVAVNSCPSYRTLSQVSRTPLKHKVLVSDTNGMSIEIYARYSEVLQSAAGTWFMHETTKPIYKETLDDSDWHNIKTLLRIINTQLKTSFDSITIGDTDR